MVKCHIYTLTFCPTPPLVSRFTEKRPLALVVVVVVVVFGFGLCFWLWALDAFRRVVFGFGLWTPFGELCLALGFGRATPEAGATMSRVE